MKSILTASYILILSIASFFTQADINITFNTPAKVSAGESFVLDIELDKGDISNFAKLQLNFPEGFTAELLEGKGGTFTFYDQKMKLIWISLPSYAKFNVQVKVTTEKSIAGDFNFNGKISYVIDGERSSKDLVTNSINVSPNATANTPPTTSAGTTGVGIKPTNNGEAELSCARSFDASQVAPGETFLVELKINKSNVSGVGKIIENIPDGFTAQEIQSNGAIFSQKGTQIKFLWMTLPAEDEFTVSYKIAVDRSLSGNKVIDGKMSFLDGSDTRYAIIESTSIEVTNSPSVETQPTETISTASTSNDNDDNGDTPTDNQIITTTSENETETDEAITSNTTTTELETTSFDSENTNDDSDNESADNGNGDSAPAMEGKQDDNGNIIVDNPDGGPSGDHQVNYRVQICALKTQVPTRYFTKNHNVNEHIYLNQHEGWSKYTVGDFKKYMGAQAHRDVAKNSYKINGSFVTAYNNGTRITVQEALMITKDEWQAPQ